MEDPLSSTSGGQTDMLSGLKSQLQRNTEHLLSIVGSDRSRRASRLVKLPSFGMRQQTATLPGQGDRPQRARGAER